MDDKKLLTNILLMSIIGPLVLDVGVFYLKNVNYIEMSKNYKRAIANPFILLGIDFLSTFMYVLILLVIIYFLYFKTNNIAIAAGCIVQIGIMVWGMLYLPFIINQSQFYLLCSISLSAYLLILIAKIFLDWGLVKFKYKQE